MAFTLLWALCYGEQADTAGAGRHCPALLFLCEGAGEGCVINIITALAQITLSATALTG